MTILKYGDLSRKIKEGRIKAKCPICHTKVLLNKDDYQLGDPVWMEWIGMNLVEEHQMIGRYIRWECPMCDSSIEKLVKFRKEKIKALWKKFLAM